MRVFLLLTTTAVLALAIGLGSAWFMVVTERTDLLRIGPWTALAPIDAASADPYRRALVARTGEIGMGTGQGAEFRAAVDDTGADLDGHCDYVVAGLTPTARLWTLTVRDRDGRPMHGDGRTHLHSREVLRGDGGRFEIAVSATARPGNWLPAPADGPMTLVLRLYDTSTTVVSDPATTLPTIHRRGCR